MLELLEARLAPTINLSLATPLPMNEGDSGTTDMIFTVTRSGDTAAAFTVDYATQDGTAVAGTDYVATSGTLTFAGNELVKTIAVPIIGNTIPQDNRAFSVELSNQRTTGFAEQQTFQTGLFPMSVASADFNGDGKPDLVVADSGSDTVSVLQNQTVAGEATPTFLPRRTFTTGFRPFSVAVADVNGDGKLDLAIANFDSNTVSVLLNSTAFRGDFVSFNRQQTFATESGPRFVAFADINGDGRPDLVVANTSSNTVSVLLNTTSKLASIPSFAAQQSFVTGRDPISVAIGDVNGDGKLDLAVANETDNTVSVLLNTTVTDAAIVSFAPQQTFNNIQAPISLAFGDVDGDGKPDLAVADSTDEVYVLLNTTATGALTPSFTLPQIFGGAGTYPSSVALGDVNGDGKPDLVVASVSGVALLTNTTVTGAASPSFAAEQHFAAGFDPSAVALGDFNGDGKLDLAVSNNNGLATVSVLLNTFNESFSLSGSPATGAIVDDDGHIIRGTVYDDVNNNKVLDPGEFGLPGLTVYLDRNGNGILDAGEPSTVSAADGSYSLTVTDTGTVSLRVVHPAQWQLTGPDALFVNITGGPTLPGNDFGVLPATSIIQLTSHANLFPTPSGNSTQSWLVGVYRAVLNRDPEVSGSAYWQALLSQGTTQAQVVQLIWESAEHRGQQVDSYYRTFLNRNDEAAGRQFWINTLLAGASEQDVTLGFVTSTEYQARNSDDLSYVRSLYTKLLGRSSSTAEETNWQQQLQAGLTRPALVQQFLISDELFRNAVEAYYSAYLHRMDDTAGFNFWMSQPRTGRSLEAIGVGYLTSGEFIGAAL